MVSEDYIKREYPLHWLVWYNLHQDLDGELSNNLHDKEKHDPRGRTPLMLAVTLGHLESVRVLLQHRTNVNTENRDGWTVVQEAVSTGDPELLQMILERRDYQRYSSRVGGIPGLLQKLKEAPDFYVEMKWEFTSWVPLVSRMCPSDTYRVFKQGSNVRIDTTLLGFDQASWQRGNKSYIFKGQSESALMMEVDHETHQVYVEQMRMCFSEDLQFLQTEEAICSRLTTPIVTTYIDTDKISFERNKSGIWGWRSDKSEPINGHECKVFGASNVELVTKTRTEHLTEGDKVRAKSPKTPLQSFLGIAEVEEKQAVPDLANEEYAHIGNPCNITPEEYFDKDADLLGKDIGRPKEIITKIQKFKATLWLCEDYPLSLQEQIMPIVDLMAISSSHFAKLKDFIQMQLPAGFPVKIEIPLFHVLNARITFGNIFAMDDPITGVTCIKDDEKCYCIVEDSCFESPASYTKMGVEGRRQFSMEEEDELLQFAIQQSLLEAGSEKDEVDIWEALRAQKPSRPNTPQVQEDNEDEEKQLQRAIQESLNLFDGPSTASPLLVSKLQGSNLLDCDEELALALEVSAKNHEEEEMLRQQEEKLLEEVLQLSLEDK